MRRGARGEVLNTWKVVNRKFDTGISYRGTRKKEKAERKGKEKKCVELCAQRENGRAGRRILRQ